VASSCLEAVGALGLILAPASSCRVAPQEVEASPSGQAAASSGHLEAEACLQGAHILAQALPLVLIQSTEAAPHC
jgi:hypothetical protein